MTSLCLLILMACAVLMPVNARSLRNMQLRKFFHLLRDQDSGAHTTSVAHRSDGFKCCPGVECFQTGGLFSHLPEPTCVEHFGVTFHLYTQDNRDSPDIIERNGALPSSWKTTGRTIFVVHGYQNDHESSYMLDIKDKLLDHEDANVINVDWRNGANRWWYPWSAANTRTVGAEIALLITRLTAEGYDLQPWCIGFSLGAHTCGFAGQRSQISRITGLDPAGPKFALYDEVARLNPSSAALVDVIHTDGAGWIAYYGMLVPSGHIDFYANRGFSQPGCITKDATYKDPSKQTPMGDDEPADIADRPPTWGEPGSYDYDYDYDPSDEGDGSGPIVYGWGACSHGRAYEYFIETFDGCFTASHTCTDALDIPRSCTPCTGDNCPKMGYFAGNSSARGIFHLETDDDTPFCISNV